MTRARLIKLCRTAAAGWVLVSGGVSPQALAKAKSEQVPAAVLEIVYNQNGKTASIKAFTLADLRRLNAVSRQEKDPADQKVSHWKGVLLSEVIEEAMKGLTVEQRATVDLLVLAGDVEMPRGFANKYPVLLAFEQNGQAISEQGPFFSVVPWSASAAAGKGGKKNIHSELLPIEKFFVPKLKRIELTNYRNRYQSDLFLLRRTDPLTVRGEKRYVQTCLGCHAQNRMLPAGQLSNELEKPHFVALKHGAVKGMPILGDVEVKALRSYLKAIQVDPAAGASADNSMFRRISNQF